MIDGFLNKTSCRHHFDQCIKPADMAGSLQTA